MKIKTLKIHNIASFEDLTLDFDRAPLADADLFLLNGETGSGKSTILDAICLALYGDTPRLQASKGLGDRDADLPDDISYNDCRRMLRQGTGAGWVRLSFDADGSSWLAEWAVQRARKKPSGKLQQKSWTLTDLGAGRTITKDAEIRAHVQRLTGLDFAQFCRTTMLSQGQFAAFLTSNKDEKAELLQKIVGVDIFQKIGAKIYEVTAQKAEACMPLRQELDIYTRDLPTPERLQELAEKRRAYTQQRAEAVARRERLLDMSAWVKTAADLAAKSAEADKGYADAIAAAADRAIADAARQIAVYDRTGDARLAIRARRDSVTAAANALGRLDKLSGSYKAALAGLLDLHKDKQTIADSLAECETQIKARAADANVLQNSAEICRELRNTADAIAKIKAKRSERDKRAADIKKTLKPKVDKAVMAEEGSRRKLSELQQTLDKVRNEVRLTNVADKRQRKEALVAGRNGLMALSAAVTELANCRKGIAYIRNALDDTQKRLTEAVEKLPEARHAVDIAKTARDTQQKACDEANLAAGQSARDIRAKLRPGDKCPVCGATVGAELSSDRLLQQLAEKARLELDRLNTAYDEALVAKKGVEARVDTMKALVATQRERLDAKMRESEKRDADIAAKCLKAGIEWIDRADTDSLQYICSERITAADAAIAELSQAITAADKLEKQATDLQSDVDRQHRDVTAAADKLLTARRLLTDAEKAIAEIDANIAANNDTLAAINQRLDKTLAGANVTDKDRASDPAAYADDLQGAAERYAGLINQKTELQTQLADFIAVIGRCERHRDNIVAMMPAWANTDAKAAGKAADAAGLESLFSNLVSDVTAATANFEDARRQTAEKDRMLSEFYAANSDLDSQEVRAAADMDDDAVRTLRNKVQNANNRVIAAETALKTARAELETHLASRPVGLVDERADTEQTPDSDKPSGQATDSYTPSQLAEATAKAEADISEADSELALIEKNHAESNAHKAKIAEITDRLNVLQAEHNRWKQLCDLLGDSAGRRFRNIALSHILGLLIDSANVYMHRLNDRYTLDVYPGSFNIMVTDRYNGMSQRTANTISGGETFLVSLALALALSDMTELRGCDTLFIDEGFGSLSGAPLERAVNTLRSLHHQVGRRIGIISHIAELREKIPTQIIVERPTGHAAQIRILPDTPR